ncbi:F-box protein At4g00755 isoform X1 [Typha latifolia]|uniref:F-box protein At4g00755 isoform X1 n=1 Tax=Typha latifolia TaxID=4733 RepID=UPI003C2E7DB6
MENSWDFLEWLGSDTTTSVFSRLDDPADLVRAAAVSRSWRKFVVTNGFSKKLCLRICPEVSNFTCIMEVSSLNTNQEAGSSTAMEWKNLESQHKIYAYLFHCLVSPKGNKDCIHHCLGASSTDNFPDESIANTLEPSDRVDMRPSYWSSGGKRDPGIPESLTYRLTSGLCVINEIKIKPFKGQYFCSFSNGNTFFYKIIDLIMLYIFFFSAFFQFGDPIYSAKSVRFSMGYFKLTRDSECYVSDENEGQLAVDENYVWTYVSPEFPMSQDNVLQSFKLPRPALCIGGVVKIELLGRVQKQAMDNLYYICVCHVQVIGFPLSPCLVVDVSDTRGNLVLKYSPSAALGTSPDGASVDEAREPSRWHAIATRIRHLGAGGGWNQAILNTLLGPPVQFIDEDDDDSDMELLS